MATSKLKSEQVQPVNDTSARKSARRSVGQVSAPGLLLRQAGPPLVPLTSEPGATSRSSEANTAEQLALGPAASSHLLGQTLAPVALQRMAGPARGQFLMPGPIASRLRYLDLFVLIAGEEAIHPQFRLEYLPVLYAIREVVNVLDANDLPAAKIAIADLLSAIPKSFVTSGARDKVAPIVIRLIGDTLNAGLFLESRQLSKAFTVSDRWIPTLRGNQEDREHAIYSTLVERAISEVRTSTPQDTEASINRLLRLFEALAQQLPAYSGDNRWETLLKDLVVASAAAFQALMESTTAELESRPGKTGELERARGVLKRMANVMLPRYPEQPIVSVEVTTSDFSSKHKRHLDYFRQGRGAPSVGISAYSRVDPSFSEKKLGLRRLLEIRFEQLFALETIFGHERDPTSGQVTDASKENVEAVKATKGFRLDSNESWRLFTLEKFQRANARLEDKAKALWSTINVLKTYLQAFTIHTPYNIDDFGQDYLSKTFPRALTGQLIHDCGVYALRVAYALSLVRMQLDLDFRAIVLPVHVGLIISFKNQSHPIYIVHNNEIKEIDEDELNEHRQRLEEAGKPVKPHDLHAQIAAGLFIQGIDIPFRTAQVPTEPEDAKARDRRLALWKFYMKKLVRPDVVQPAGGMDQPELMYLLVLDSQRTIHDEQSAPLWKKGMAWWQQHETALERARDQFNPRSTAGPLRQAAPIAAANLMYREEIRPLWEKLWNMSQSWREAIVKHDKLRREITEFIKQHPTAVHPSARLTEWGERGMPWDEERVFWEYVGDPGGDVDRLETNSSTAFDKIVAKGNSRLLKGDILPPWWGISQLLRPND